MSQLHGRFTISQARRTLIFYRKIFHFKIQRITIKKPITSHRFLNRRCRVFPRQSLLKKKDWIRYRKSVELKVGSFFPVDIHIVNLGEKSFNIFFVVNLFLHITEGAECSDETHTAMRDTFI